MSIVKLTWTPVPVVASIAWHWDDETDILSGAFSPAPDAGKGPTAALEITDEEGTIIVLDVVGGVLCGIDIVVWPDIITEPDLVAPATTLDGRMLVPEATEDGPAIELNAPIMMRTTVDEAVLHMRVGSPRAVSTVRVANNLLIEIDADQALAGFWLLGVPPLPPLAEDEL